MRFNEPKHANRAQRRWPLLLGFALVLLTGSWNLVAQDTALPETHVKAAFLVNFPKYVEWPAGTFPETNSPIVVATLGETDLSDDVRRMVQGRIVNGRPLVFKVVAEADLTGNQHILFIPDSARRRLSAVLDRLNDSRVLTVGESDDFLSRGGIINLARRDQKVRLEVNLVAARQANLKISSKLLSVADVVKGK